METRKDYYNILELTDEDKKLPKEEFLKKLSRQYKRLAVKWHPDRNPGNKEAEEKFKEINEANQVLSDYDGKKAEYDNPMSGFHFTGNMDMDDILRNFTMDFGGFNPFGGQWQNMNQARQKGRDIQGQVECTLEDILKGATKKVRYKRDVVCHECHGTGRGNNTREEKCPHCGGTGLIVSGNGMFRMTQTCPYCHGKRTILINPCKTCGGHGVETRTEEYSFMLPKGVSQGMYITANGMGNEIPGNGNIPGDLTIIPVEKPHDIFKREGSDLVMKLDVGVIDAILGCKKRITTLEGKKLDIKVPNGCEDGRKLMLSGYGLPEYNSGLRGRLILVIHVVMPKTLTDKDIKALEKLRKSESFNL